MHILQFTKYHTDVLRIFFCLTVTMSHVSFATYNYHIFHNYGVPAFFLISGYVCYTSLNKYSFSLFIKKRLSSLIIPYYISILVYLVLFSICSKQVTMITVEVLHVQPVLISLKQNFINVISHLLFIHNLWGSTSQSVSPNLWFMGALMQLYLLSPLLFYVIRKKIFVAVVVFIGYFAASITLQRVDINIGGGTNLSCITSFMLGMVFAKYTLQILTFVSTIFYNNSAAKYAYIFFIICITFVISNPPIQYISVNGVITFISMPFFIILINYIRKFIKPKFISKVVPVTYFIYLYNLTCVGVFRLTSHNGLNFLLSFITIICFSYSFYKLDIYLRKVNRASKKVTNDLPIVVVSAKLK